ncbi:MAG TPA: hypothetical protein VGJ48_25245 [Pyrinomonadaceae bacterium]|jgi:hypothetical protein
MVSLQLDSQQYVKQVIECYCRTPGTLGRARRSDRHLAAAFYERGIPLSVIRDALILATGRRTLRDPTSPTLPPIRSLHYFVPIIDELTHTPLDPDYIRYIECKLKKHGILP